MKSVYWSLIFSLPFTALKAEDSIEKLYLLSEDVRSVVLKTPEGHPMPKGQFHLTSTQSDQIKAISGLDNLTREHIEASQNKDCDKKNPNQSTQELEEKVKKREFEISFMVRTSDYRFEQNTIGRFMNDDYANFIGKLIINGNSKAIDVATLDSLKAKYLSINPKSDLSKLSFEDQVKTLESFANLYLGTMIPTGIVMKEMAFQSMVSDSANWKTILGVARDTLTNQQKIELVSKVGGFFGNRYNYDRFNLGDKATGYVSIEQLFDSVKSGKAGGVCRDIALAQTQMLRELGFKNNYVVTYKTLNGYHSDVITTDPATGKIVKFNYSEATEMKKGTGTAALIQDSTMPDHGLNFRIHDADGKPVTQVPSELGQMLREATGGDTRPFLDSNYSLAKVGVKFGGVDGNLFVGKTSTGENLYGLALFKKFNSEYVSVEGGLAISKLEGNRTFMTLDQENLYARLAAEVRSPTLELGRLSLSAFAGAEGEVLGYRGLESYRSGNLSKETENMQFDARAELQVGLRGRLDLSSSTILTTKTYTTFYPDIGHVAKADKVGLFKDSIIVESGISHSLSDQQAVILESSIMLKNYGTSMGIRAAYEDYENKIRVHGSYSTPLSKEAPSFLPGMNSHFTVGIDKETSKGLTFSIEYDRNIEQHSNGLFFKGSYKF